MRLIDADAYSKKVCTYNETGCGSCNVQTICPFDEPTIDAVPVRHGKFIGTEYDEKLHCGLPHGIRLKDDYCSDAERKE